MAFSSKKKPPASLKSYIDAQILLLRVEQLKKKVSTDILNEYELKECNMCIKFINEAAKKENKVVEDVSEEGNDKIIMNARSLLENVRDINDSRLRTAAEKAERATKPVSVQVQATGVWLRYKDGTSGKYFFYNNLTKDVVWVLPVGATYIEWDDPNVQWNTEARFQIINPYLVS
jgi:hypothetical protein